MQVCCLLVLLVLYRCWVANALVYGLVFVVRSLVAWLVGSLIVLCDAM